MVMISPVTSAGIALSRPIPSQVPNSAPTPRFPQVDRRGDPGAMETTTRTPAQVEASRKNGAMSTGPVTVAGKVIVSTNAVNHGLATRAALLPSERAEDYQANLTGWLATLRPRTPGEGQVAARVADTGFRLDRLARVEERMVNDALEARVASSEPAKALQTAKEAFQGVQGLAALAEGVAGPVDAAPVSRLLPGMRLVAKLVGEVDLPVGPVAALDSAIDRLVIETAIEVEPAGFQTLATAAREVEAVLQAKVEGLTAAVEAERERLADLVVLGDGEDMRVLDRHRARLHRELQAQLATVRLLRELAVPDEAGGPAPLLVELRLVGRGSAR
jgi:hypothetical protein